MDDQILSALGELGEATGWEVWVLICERMDKQPKVGPEYNAFKRSMDKLDKAGHIVVLTVGVARMAKATWTVTEAGQEALGARLRLRAAKLNVGDAEAKTAEDYVGKRHRAEDGSIPRAVWKELLKRHSDGELDIAFLPHKPRA